MTQTLTLKSPFIITPRLMAGLKIGNAFISMGQGERNSEGRTHYGAYIDLPDGSEHEVTDLRSGCQGGGLQEGFASLLSFLSAAGESYAYAMRQGRDGMTRRKFRSILGSCDRMGLSEQRRNWNAGD